MLFYRPIVDAQFKSSSLASIVLPYGVITLEFTSLREKGGFEFGIS